MTGLRVLLLLSSTLTACVISESAPPPAVPPAAQPASASPKPALKTPEPVTLRFPGAWKEFCHGPQSVSLEMTGSRHFVEVTLPGAKGDRKLRFHVDTGGNTPGLMIHRSVAESLGFSDAKSLPRKLTIGGQEFAVPEKASWTLLDDTKKPSATYARRKNYSVGQLGAGFLSRFLVCIDPEARRLALGDPSRVRVAPGGARQVRLMMQKGGKNEALYPFVHGWLFKGGKRVAGYGLLLDTGATTSMLDRFKIKWLREKQGVPVVAGTSGDANMVGGGWPELMGRVDEFHLHTISGLAKGWSKAALASVPLGPATFVSRPNQTFGKMFGNVRQTMGSHGALANDVLNRHRLMIDYAQATLFLEPARPRVDASASMVRVGLAFAFDEAGCPVIRQVSDKSDATTKRGVKSGDVLLAIDGVDACKLWHHESSAKLSGKPGERRRLKLRRGKRELEVLTTVVDLWR